MLADNPTRASPMQQADLPSICCTPQSVYVSASNWHPMATITIRQRQCNAEHSVCRALIFQVCLRAG